ncbi:phosphoadenosine phosphosulfate reductase family protein [Bacillus toyonensis]|uniref:phosphoadenosine phosphosulfate reductase domain-containing protein n=1 Tax=Bacillus toyonensis TaxID=155322 RepID=UPI002E1FD20E|nr:phosphoadenosine phosphosulfate reductase family protein [Bacillus toyonensis]MED2737343.1 phosphoadenosine phosphosulfate reductase family protein [Bacillus toyonensis]
MNGNAVIKRDDEELFETLRLLDELNSGEMDCKFNEIITYLEETYIKEDKEWIVTYSGGKDSSLVLALVFKMLQRLPKRARFKRVHIVSADTKVESYQMTSYLKKNLKLIKQFEEELNLVVHLVEPDMKNSFFWNVIGRGVVAPKPPSPFQWCTKKMKIKPMNIKLKQILAEAPVNLDNTSISMSDLKSKKELANSERPYDAMMLLGSRLDESSKRARSINKYSFDENDLFAVNPDFNNVKMFYPIKFVKTSDLWAYITSEEYLPWGLKSMELFEMYSDGSGECPMTREELTETKGCGSTNSRNGCWVCLYAGRNDKMLETLVSSGHTEVEYLSEWKAFLYDVAFDVRYREPLKRDEVKRNTKRLSRGAAELDLFSEGWLNEDFQYYYDYEKTEKSDYIPGGFTFELRLILLQKLLYAQEKVGYSLIEDAELNAILDSWIQEGYSFTFSDIQPINHQYDGQLNFKTDGSINLKETENNHKIFYVNYEFEFGETKLIEFFKERQQQTGKSFYCFFDNKDYETHKVVFNVLKFVVCEKNINTQQEADELIFRWLYQNGEQQEMTNKTFNAALDMLMRKNIEEGILLNAKSNE